MASGYYYQEGSYDNQYSSNSPYNINYQSTPPLSFHLCLVLLTIFLCLGMSWYLSYESVVESIVDQLRILLILSPIVLLLAVHFLSNGSDRGRVPFLGSLPERESLYRAGGSPWGVALVLVLLLFMISYKSSFQERWFTFRSR